MKRYLTPESLMLLACLVLAVGLSTGKALLSMSTIGLSAAVLWYWYRDGLRWPAGVLRMQALWLVSLFALPLISGLWTANSERWLLDSYEKLPLLALPIAFSVLPRLTHRQWRWLQLLFLAAQTMVALATMLQFALNYDAQMARVADNSYIDIVGSISHIYFGLLLGLSILLGWDLWRQYPAHWPARWRGLLLAVLVLNTVVLHVLVSRTGLLSFYAGLSILLWLWLWHSGRRWLSLALVLALVAMPVLAYVSIPSFRVRAQVTLWDWQQYQQPEADLTDNSLSLRLLAWQASADIVREHPWLGVGMEDVGAEMMARYEARGLDQRGSGLLDNPHNQYLKQWAGIGLPGLLGLLLALGYPIWWQRKRAAPLLVAVMATFAVAMLFESLLERQIGMTAFAALSMWTLQAVSAEGSSSC